MQNLQYTFLSLLLLLAVTLSSQSGSSHNVAILEELSTKQLVTSSYSTGVVVVDQRQVIEAGGIQYLLDSISTANNYTLKLSTQLNKNANTYYYQQYYDDVLVKGAGVRIAYSDIEKRGTGDPGPDNPCISPRIVNLSLLGGFQDINHKAGTLPNDILGFVDFSQYPGEFKLSGIPLFSLHPDKSGSVMYGTQFLYIDQSEYYIGWFDLITNTIVSLLPYQVGLSANTLTYGTVELDDLEQNNGTTKLISQDEVVWTFDYTNLSRPSDIPDTELFNNPSTNNVATWDGSIPLVVAQAHHVVTNAIEVMKQPPISVEFDKIYVISHSDNTDRTDPESTLEHAQIYLGDYNNGGTASTTSALFDIAAHELGHCILLDPAVGIDYFVGDNAVVHEGFADIIGSYVEYKIQGNTSDWIMGDDDAITSNAYNRDLSDPQHFCYVPGVDYGSNHSESMILSHWYYTIAQGDVTIGIPGLGIERATEVVMKSIYSLSQNTNIPNFRDVTIAMVEVEYGTCSPEYTHVVKAWQKACLAELPTCDIFIAGSPYACEEHTTFSICVDNPLPDETYQWTFPIEWTIYNQNGSGNGHAGNCLTVSSLPTYNTYPFTSQISVYPANLGVDYKEQFTFSILDCDGSSTGCVEKMVGTTQQYSSNSMIEAQSSQVASSLQLFDIGGRKMGVFEPTAKLHLIGLPRGVYFIVKLDSEGKYIETQKIVL